MKFVEIAQSLDLVRSHLVRGAWIEIFSNFADIHLRRSHLVRGAWIEIEMSTPRRRPARKSHLVRGAWIEMLARRSAGLNI